MHTNVPARPQIRCLSLSIAPFHSTISFSFSLSIFLLHVDRRNAHRAHTNTPWHLFCLSTTLVNQHRPILLDALACVTFFICARYLYVENSTSNNLALSLIQASTLYSFWCSAPKKEIKKQLHSNLFSFCITQNDSFAIYVQRSLNQAHCILC